jgi:hypothetical protein
VLINEGLVLQNFFKGLDEGLWNCGLPHPGVRVIYWGEGVLKSQDQI